MRYLCDMIDDFYLVSKYLAKHWNEEFSDIKGCDILNNIILVFFEQQLSTLSRIPIHYFNEQP